MKVNWKRIDDHEIQTHASCLVSLNPLFPSASHLAVAFLNGSGRWQMGNGEVCWFEPIYFAYFNEIYERES